MTAIVCSDSRDILEFAALTDFLVRSGPRGAAIAATDRLASALLAFSRERCATERTAAVSVGREALRLRAEAVLLGRRLRIGPVRHAPAFRGRVERLLLADVGTADSPS